MQCQLGIHHALLDLAHIHQSRKQVVYLMVGRDASLSSALRLHVQEFDTDHQSLEHQDIGVSFLHLLELILRTVKGSQLGLDHRQPRHQDRLEMHI